MSNPDMKPASPFLTMRSREYVVFRHIRFMVCPTAGGPIAAHLSDAYVFDAMADPKADLRLPRIVHAYLDDLVDLGIYGKDKSAVIRHFVELGIQQALGKNLVSTRKRRDFGDETEAD